MKIVFCLPGNDWGGIGREPVRTLAAALSDAGGMDISSIALSHEVSRVTRQGKVILVPSRRSVTRCMLDGFRKERLALAEEIHALSPDIVHVHWTQMGHGLGALDSGLPLVVTAHDAALESAYWNWNWHPGSVIASLRGLQISRQILRKANHVIAVSPYVKQHIEKVFLRHRDTSISVISNPVVNGVTSTKASEVAENQPVFVAIGHWGALKRFDLALRAFEEVVRELPQATFLLFGKDLDENGLAHRWAIDRGLARQVSFLGQRSHDYIMDLLSSSVSCLVHPSRTEGFGLAVAEAMSFGVPVITSNAGALPWLLEDGRSGTIVQSSTPSAWSEAMIGVATSLAAGAVSAPKKDFGTMANRAVVRIRELCDPQMVARQHREVYESMLT